MKMRKYVVEFIGAFSIGVVVLMALAIPLDTGMPFAAGLMYMAMLYAGRHVSGGHFNPAISLAVYLRGRLALGELPAYLFAQCAGAILAALLCGYLLRASGQIATPAAAFHAGPALLAEFMGAFIVCYVFLHMTLGKGTSGNVFFGIAVGGVYTATATAVYPVSNGILNPAIATGLSVAQWMPWNMLWMFVLAPLAGGAVAAFVFNYVNGPE
jgi:aquaporin Z